MTLTISQRRSWARRGAADIDRTIAEAKTVLAEEKRQKDEAAHAAYAAKYAPVPFTEEQWKAARVVRKGSIWHEVVRVSAKSVTVPDAFAVGTYRISRDRIDEVRT